MELNILYGPDDVLRIEVTIDDLVSINWAVTNPRKYPKEKWLTLLHGDLTGFIQCDNVVIYNNIQQVVLSLPNSKMTVGLIYFSSKCLPVIEQIFS